MSSPLPGPRRHRARGIHRDWTVFYTVGMVTGFPFVFLNHGTLGAESFGSAASIWIGFAQPLTASRLKWTIDTCPEPLAGLFYADDALLYCETAGPETFESAVSRLYGDDTGIVTLSASRRFGVALEKWARQVSASFPIAFLCGPGTVRIGSYKSARLKAHGASSIHASSWAHWSARRMPSVIDWLEDYLDNHEDMPLTEEAPGEDWPARPMNRLMLSFIADSIPEGRDSVYDESDDLYMAERVDDLRARLDYRGRGRRRSAST